MTKLSLLFEKYRVLVKEIDEHAAILENVHQKHMKCRNGCDLCCMDFSIFPVEYYHVMHELEHEQIELEMHANKEVCGFLKNHSCTIYRHRPIMCRTHGLPLLYTNESGEPELSACHLNFTEFDFEDFTMENTLPQDKYNSKLFLLNREFVAEFKDKKHGEFDLIPLKQLAGQLKKGTF